MPLRSGGNLTWDHATREALATAAHAELSPLQAARLLQDPGASHLARVLADAASRGAHPAQVLRAAVDYDDLTHARSTTLILAARIHDYPTTLGIPRDEPANSPLPRLPFPDIGHPAWTSYLHDRARLIADRAAQLGSLDATYREQYHLTGRPATAMPRSTGAETSPPSEPERDTPGEVEAKIQTSGSQGRLRTGRCSRTPSLEPVTRLNIHRTCLSGGHPLCEYS